MSDYDILLTDPVNPDRLMSWTWGTVQDDLTVVLDTDVSPIPTTTPALVPLYPGQRVRVDQRGRSRCIVGENALPAQVPDEGLADEYITPGRYAVRNGASADLAHGFPEDGVSGWLEVLGDGQMVLQRYTTYGGRVWQRRYGAGEWGQWTRIDHQPYVPPGPPAWETPAPRNGWEHYTSFGNFQYRLEGDVVRLRGVVRGGKVGSGTPIATLPPACRPSSTRLCLASYGSDGVDLRIGADGSVYVNSGTPSYVSLEGVTYVL